jgi:hypothetical protein
MGSGEARHLRDERQKNLVRLFNKACSRHSRWNVWADFIVMAAISISNVVDQSHAESREKTYMTLAAKYNKRELDCFGEMFGEIVNGIDACPDQDFLGELYMALELGNSRAGQFFTPYAVCRAMAAMTYGNDLEQKIAEQGWVSISDPACGAGALLVAFANECRRPGREINYQTSVLFVAQDIDLIVGCMCYIQLSLLGCPGYVVIADTLAHPATAIDGRGLIPVPSENIWYTPFYFRDIWHYRRMIFQMDYALKSMHSEPGEATPSEAEPEPTPPELNEAKGGQLTLF